MVGSRHSNPLADYLTELWTNNLMKFSTSSHYGLQPNKDVTALASVDAEYCTYSECPTDWWDNPRIIPFLGLSHSYGSNGRGWRILVPPMKPIYRSHL